MPIMPKDKDEHPLSGGGSAVTAASNTRKGSGVAVADIDAATTIVTKNALRGKKANLTRKINEAIEIIAEVPNDGAAAYVDAITDAEDAVRRARDKVIEVVDQLIECDPANYKEHEQTHAEAANAAKRVIKDCLSIKAKIKAAEDDAADARAGISRGRGLPGRRDETGKAPKVVEALRPAKLTKDASPAEFRVWRQQFKAYFETSNLDLATPTQQAAYVKVLLDGHLVDEINATADDTTDGVACLDILCNSFKAKYPVVVKRVAYFNVKQEHGESFSATITRIKNKAIDADIAKIKLDDVKVLRYLTAVRDEKLRKELMDLDNPTPGAIEQAVSRYEATKTTSSAVAAATNHGAEATAFVVNEGGGGSGAIRAYNESGGSSGTVRAYTDKKICNRCGVDNPPSRHYDNCPAADHRCGRCGKRGHFERICYNTGAAGGNRYRRENRSYSRGRGGGRDRNRSSSGSRGSYGTDRARSSSRGRDGRRYSGSSDDKPRMRLETPYNERINKVNGSRPTPRMGLYIRPDTGSAFHFNCLPDTGATRSIIAADVADKYNITACGVDGIKLTAANGEPLEITGKVDATVEQDEVSKQIEFLITPAIRNEVIIAWVDLKNLGAIDDNFPKLKAKEAVAAVASEQVDCESDHSEEGDEEAPRREALKNKMVNKYTGVISDTLPDRPMNGPPMKIHLRDDIEVKPCRVMTARQVPIHLKKEADQLVDKLVKDKIIERIDVPTDWISPGMFIPKPNGSGLRMVTDFKKLNDNCVRAVRPFPTAADIVARIPAGSKVFATMDAVMGYHQIALDEDSAKLTAFLLPQGKFVYRRGPMGCAPTNDEWNIRSDVVVDNVDSAMKVVDDIIVAAPDLDTLEQRVDTILSRCAEQGITISLKKFKISDEVSFAGYVIGKEGVKPDPERLEAIAAFKQPKNVSELRSFMGLAQQLTTFVPDLAHVTDDLRKLLKKGVEFRWLPEHEEAFQKIKKILTGDLCTAHYDVNKRTVIMTDASRLHGLGYALIQHDDNGRPKLVQCGSRSLSDAEKNYAVIETEMLAVQWAITKCHQFLAGGPRFTVATDHRPLVGIFLKQMDDLTNPRIVRMREKLARYTFDVTWVEGKPHYVADALSRAPVWDGNKCSEATTDTCAAIIAAQPMDKKIEKLKKAAEADDEYQQIKAAIGRSDVRSLPPDHPARQYRSIWSSMGTDSNSGLMIIDGRRIVVPRKARKGIIDALHEPHAGMEKTKRAARQLYYYPEINTDIEKTVNSCDACQKHRASKKEASPVHTVAEKPMEQLSTDLFDYRGEAYAVVVDRFSGYIWVKPMRRQTADAAIKAIESVVLDNGYPLAIRSDGGPCYRSEFTRWCEDNDIEHQVSSPYRSQSNGHAEAAVKVAKQLMDKMGGYNDRYKKALIEYRNAPRADGASPAQMFFGRRQRTTLPALHNAYDIIDTEEVARQRRKDIGDATEQPGDAEPELKPGQRVRVQDPMSKKWTLKGSLVGITDTKRSYEIDFDDGRRAIRNRIYVRPDMGTLDDEGAADQAEDDTSGILPSRHGSHGTTEQNELQPQRRRSSRERTPRVRFQF